MNMKVSVVMPTWNRAGIVQNAIRSIIDQTYSGWELIVLDDGSTDSTGRIVKDFAHPRIKYHKIEHQSNISKVRNIANSHATGDIIVVQDSDDLSLPDRLEEIVKVFDSSEADVVYHGMYVRSYDPYSNAITRQLREAQPFSKERLLTEQYIPGQIAYTRRTWEAIKYNEMIELCDDYMFLLELALNHAKFVPLYKNLYEYVASSDSVNIEGEVDGRRRKDVVTLLRILNEKYEIDAHATLTKNIISGPVISKEII